MSVNKVINPGFGIGGAFGTPTTVAVAPTSTVTLTGTAYPAGQYFVAGLSAGLSITGDSTTNGVTATFYFVNGGATNGGFFVNDNSSFQIVSTTTSVNVVLIPM